MNPPADPAADPSADLTTELPADLTSAIESFCQAGRVLVATDFDGVLAPLVLNPMEARPVPGGMPALTALAALPGVGVALVSGRALGPLRELSGAHDPIVLIGSHGVEDSRRPGGLALDPDQQALLATLVEELEALAAEHPDARIEAKPAGRVVHTRGMPPQEARDALAQARALAQRHTSVEMTPGKDVIELAVAHVGKGAALVALAEEIGADAVFYAGDDITDEHGFEALAQDTDRARAERRLTVRVGDGETLARFRVVDEQAIVAVFDAMLAVRRRTVGGSSNP